MSVFLVNPLKKMHITQPFGVNWSGTPDFYTKLGLKAHDGLDLSAPTGTEVFAVMDGQAYCDAKGPATGYGLNLRIRNKDMGLEVIYGHLEGFRVPQDLNGTGVRAGDLVATSDNTGYSTGPHLHFEVRPIYWKPDGSGPYKKFGANGYGGAVDPVPYLPDDAFDLPVDKGYGNILAPSVLDFAPAMLFFIRSQKRLPTFREYRALRFGYWPLREVLDPAMFSIWSEMSYPAAKIKNLVK